MSEGLGSPPLPSQGCSPSVLVVGARGWLGHAISSHLESRGVAVSPADRSWAESLFRQRRDAGSLANLRQRGRGGVINAASPGSTDEDAHAYFALSSALASVCSEMDLRLIHIGSAAEFGDPSTDRIDDDAAVNPATAYGAIKARATLDALDKGAVVLRPFNILGANQPRNTPPGDWIEQIRHAPEAEGKVLVGNPELVRDFVGLRFVAETVAEMLRLPVPAGPVNVCSGVGHDFGTVCRAIMTASGRELDVVAGEAQGIRRVVGCPTRLRSLGLYKPQELRDLAREAWSVRPDEGETPQ